MSSYLVSQNDVQNFVNTPRLYHQQGVEFVYSAPAEALKRLIPPPLKLVEPIVTGHIVQFANTTFGSSYIEFLIGSPCTYKGVTGIYSFSLMLQGLGAETAVVVGKEACGFPKKLADGMQVNRIGSKVTANLIRHGTVLLKCEVDLTGNYNDSKAIDYLGNPQPGDYNEGNYYNHKFSSIQTENGNTVFSDVKLVMHQAGAKSVFHHPGEILSLELHSTPDDPLGELAVLTPLGAAYREDEYVEMSRTLTIERLDTKRTMPYLMTGRYDRSLMGEFSNFLSVNQKYIM